MIAFCPKGHEVQVDMGATNQKGEVPCYVCRDWFDPLHELEPRREKVDEKVEADDGWELE